MMNSGEDRILRNVGPGGYFGEMALLANTPRNASVRALSNLTVMEIDKPTFIEMIRQNPKIAMSMFSTVVEWLRANDQMALSQLRDKQVLVESAYKELRYEEKRRSEFSTSVGARNPDSTHDSIRFYGVDPRWQHDRPRLADESG